MTSEEKVPQRQPALTKRPFTPLGCSAAVRLLVAAGISLFLWCVVLWALHPN